MGVHGGVGGVVVRSEQVVLSPGKWNETVPREILPNLKWRQWLLRRCREEKKFRSAVRLMCKQDLLFFINSFVYQYNPLLKSEKERVGPFVTWPYQERALTDRPNGILWCIEKDRTAVVEKSREMGASWLFLIVEDWLCIFHRHIQTLNISRNAQAVDSASKNSLFPKIRFIHKYLPRWLTGPITSREFNLGFEKTGSEITGEASTGSSGAGGRASLILVDEFSEIREAAKVRQNTASIAECRLFNGTHLDVGTEFYQLTQTPEIVKIQMHWTRHPRKNRHLYSWDQTEGRAVYWRYDERTDEIVPISETTGIQGYQKAHCEPSRPPDGFPEDYPFDRTGKPDGGPHPGIRSPWYDKKVVEIGDERRAAMELDINPTGASSQFYDALVIRRLMQKARTPDWQGNLTYDPDLGRPLELVAHSEEKACSLFLWFQPGLDSNGKLLHVPPSDYVISADLGTGRGATPSCLTIFDSSKGEKVGRVTDFYSEPRVMARLAVSLCHLFTGRDGTAHLIWETPGPGLDFGDEVLKNLNYRNIFWRTDPFRDNEKTSDIPGWAAQTNTKRHVHDLYRTALKCGDFTNWDEPALRECLAYVHEKGTVEHPKAMKNIDKSGQGLNHGDHVVADALAWFVAGKKVQYVEKPPPPEPSVRSIAGRRLLAQRQAREADVWV